MPKRGLQAEDASLPSSRQKKLCDERKSHERKISTAKNAAKADQSPPLYTLLEAVLNTTKYPSPGSAVVYWMRMEDMRIFDNRAISQASAAAKEDGVSLLVLFIISPQDYRAHDRGPRRIDFMLRNLRTLKASLDERNIPLHVITHTPRRTLPERVVSLLEEWNVKKVFGNISYEVDELRRDIRVCELCYDKGIHSIFVEDKLVVIPGILTTKNGKPYTVYSPWQRAWLSKLNDNPEWIEEASAPDANDSSIRVTEPFSALFTHTIPVVVDGFECVDKAKMATFWPAGTDVARKVLDRFLYTKAQTEQIGEVSPLPNVSKVNGKDTRINAYADGRDRADMDSTSRLSPYLASGVISARECVRATMALRNSTRVEASRNNGLGMWVQEIAWRDFYNHVMAAFPRVSMGRPYQEKYADVKWEVNEEHLQAWKDGKTGVPVVDAAMRQLNAFGWMHNRCRMIVAMYLTKDLMIDWRLGERYFMEQLIDGDLPSNNGGWQWSASTGTDPQPYFRIFNPTLQSEKADPSGNYIRHYVPELAKLTGKVIHAPSAESADAHGYSRPLIDHKVARERALRRYKNPGEV